MYLLVGSVFLLDGEVYVNGETGTSGSGGGSGGSVWITTGRI